jgi:hypothetical protein
MPDGKTMKPVHSLSWKEGGHEPVIDTGPKALIHPGYLEL